MHLLVRFFWPSNFVCVCVSVSSYGAVHEKLKKEWSVTGFNADEDEEMEDAEGNVMNRKTWEDLKRQGLL